MALISRENCQNVIKTRKIAKFDDFHGFRVHKCGTGGHSGGTGGHSGGGFV